MPLRNCGKQKCHGALRKLPVQRRPLVAPPLSTVPASQSHKLVEEDPREVVVATVLLGAQARLEGLLVDLEEEVEVD